MWPNESDYELEDEMERDAWNRDVDFETGEVIQRLTHSQEMAKEALSLCRQTLEQCKRYEVA